MANSKYEYVKEFENEDILLKNTWVVVRIDGRGFHKYETIGFPFSYQFLISPFQFRIFFDSDFMRLDGRNRS